MTAGRSGATSERLKVGIVGGGAITQVAHLPVLKKMLSVDVQAICDTDLPKARALADRFGIKDAFDDIEDAIATCEELGVGVRVCLDMFHSGPARMSVEDVGGLPTLALTRTPTSAIGLALKYYR